MHVDEFILLSTIDIIAYGIFNFKPNVVLEINLTFLQLKIAERNKASFSDRILEKNPIFLYVKG